MQNKISQLLRKNYKHNVGNNVFNAYKSQYPQTDFKRIQTHKGELPMQINKLEQNTNQQGKVQKKDISFITKNHLNEQCNTNRYRNSLRNS